MLNINKNKKAAIVGLLIVISLIIAISLFAIHYSSTAIEEIFKKPIGKDQLNIISTSQDVDLFILKLNKVADEVSTQILFELNFSNNCSYYADTPLLYCNNKNNLEGNEKEIIKRSFINLLKSYIAELSDLHSLSNLPDYDLYIYTENGKTIIIGKAKEEREFNILIQK